MAALDAPAGDDLGPGAALPTPWHWWEALVVFLLAFVVGGIAVVAVQAAVPGPVGRGLAFPVSLAPLGVLAWLWVRVRHPDAVGRLAGPRRPRGADAAFGAASGVAAFVLINVALLQIVQVLARLVGFDVPAVQPELREAVLDPQTMPYLIVAAVVVAPIVEELFFRGMLFQSLRASTGFWVAAAVSAVAFGFAHLQATPVATAFVFASIFPLGVFLAWLLDRRRSLAAPVAAHATFNLISVVGMLAGLG